MDPRPPTLRLLSCNIQAGSIVYGIEADIQYADVGGNNNRYVDFMKQQLRELLTGYGKNADATWILDHHEVHLLLQTGRHVAERGRRGERTGHREEIREAVHLQAESMRRELPKLAISGSVYSEDPASRFLIVNGEVLHEGAKLGAELVLVPAALWVGVSTMVRPSGARPQSRRIFCTTTGGGTRSTSSTITPRSARSR